MVDLTLIIGIAGMFILLIAFILNLFVKLSQDSITYGLLNTIGGLLLAFYAYTIESFPFLVLEMVWTISAFYKTVLVWIK